VLITVNLRQVKKQFKTEDYPNVGMARSLNTKTPSLFILVNASTLRILQGTFSLMLHYKFQNLLLTFSLNRLCEYHTSLVGHKKKIEFQLAFGTSSSQILLAPGKS